MRSRAIQQDLVSILMHTAVSTPASGSPDLRQSAGEKVSMNTGNTAATSCDKVVAVQP